VAGRLAADDVPVTVLRLALLAFLLLIVAAPASARAPSVPASPKERQVLAALNEVRAAFGLPQLRFAPALWRAARKHSRDMGQRGYFSHSSRASGESFDKRVLRFQDRTKVRWLGETIGWGAGDLAEPEQMVQMWMDSPPHRRTILDRRFRIVGIGTWAGEFMGHQGVRIYTADFGG
jgi:uncharacterized protein YkwD